MMEEKKTVFYYVRQAFATYGVIVLVFAIMSIVIGERTKDYAALFSMGNAGMSMPILMELLLLAVIITLAQVVFLTDTWIMNMSMMIRNVLFFVSVLIVIVFMIVAFNWFPTRDMTAWLGFIISYALSMIISALITILKERAENTKIQEALDKYNRRKTIMKKYRLPIILLAVFEAVAITLWLTKNNLFYLFNFSYIGLSISLGVFLFIRKYNYARRIVQLLVGLYMLIYLGLICQENMQIEGFWYYLFTGVFEAATIHYAVAKIFGPLIFGRGWCGYACWTAMVLDFLPYKEPNEPRRNLGWIRYITFAVSLIFVSGLFLAKVGNIERIMFLAFVIGNIAYYGTGIALAFAFKDNRAFCKYICPITVFLKPMSYFSMIRIKCDKEKCISCGKCKRVCPMNVDVTDNSRKRKNGTECILCMECVKNCPKNAL